MTNLINILLVDAHEHVRLGLRALVTTAADMQVVGEAANGLTAVHLVQTVKPHVVVMELTLPLLGGAAAITAIRRANPQTHILVLTEVDDAQQVITAAKAGARGFLQKGVSLSTVLSSIRDIHNGRTAFDANFLPLLMRTHPHFITQD